MRKRSLAASSVRDRFCRLAALMEGSEIICRLRFKSRPDDLLTIDRFASDVVAEWPPFDGQKDLLAIQSFVPGPIYRHFFNANEKSSTHIVVVGDGDERASRLADGDRKTDTLDAATKSIVSFIERSQHARIISLHVDYAFDQSDRLWLLWIGDAKVVASKRQLLSPISPVKDSLVVKDIKPINQALPMVDEAGGSMIPDRLRVGGGKNQLLRRRRPTNKRESKTFPSSQHNCAGDFCDFVIQDPMQLFSRSEVALLSSTKTQSLKTELVRDATRQRSSASSSSAHIFLSYKSIALAREEKRCHAKQETYNASRDGNDPWMEYPETPRDLLAQLESSPTTAHIKTRASKATGCSRGKLPFEGSLSSYYRTVRVCENCFCVYSLLDKVRDLLVKSKEALATQALKAAAAPAAADSAVLKRLTNQRGSEPPKVPEGSVSMVSAPEDNQRNYERYRVRPSWKCRISAAKLCDDENASLPESGEMSAKFEKIDEYLRGKADSGLRQLEAKAAAIARSRAAQSRIAEASSLDVASIYFGRILIIDSRESKELQELSSFLENAGFTLDIFLDARNAIEKLIEEFAIAKKLGWRLDAVVVTDLLDIGDAFDIVNEVRKMEQAFVEQKAKRFEAKIKAAAMQPHKHSSYELSQFEFFRPLPIVFLTGKTAPEDLRKYQSAGMDGCISKPLTQTALLSTLRAAVPRHGKPVEAEQGKRKSCEVAVIEAKNGINAIVSFTVKFEKQHDTVEIRNFADEAASQLGIERSRVECTAPEGDTNDVVLRISGFRSGDSGEEFLKALKGRTRLVPEERWGRQILDNFAMTCGDGNLKNVEKKQGTQALVSGVLGTAGATSSSAMAAKSLSLSASFTATGGSVGGVLQLDADTSLPYCVMDYSLDDKGIRQRATVNDTFNLVVCHDFFDTFERMKIFLSPIAAKYPGLQVLLWNYPGQAFTEWREEQILDNAFMANCLNELITHVGSGSQGTKQFDDESPFYLLGHGFGGSVCSFYATHYRSPNVRGILLFNGFSFVDPHLAGTLHDSMNVFSCAPPTRPDLPVYFWTRFLFSRDYLTRVSTPLALNLYTAVHNPISLKGRMKICAGGLMSRDVRPALKNLDLPIIAVQSTEGVLVKPLHAEPWAPINEQGANTCQQTIFQALKKRGTCIIWVKSGHEIFQEIRKEASTLIEQIVLGYHELKDVVFIPAEHADGAMATSHSEGNQQQQGQSQRDRNSIVGHGNFEDNFINSVLGKLHTAGTTTKMKNTASMETKRDALTATSPWSDFQASFESQIDAPRSDVAEKFGKPSRRRQEARLKQTQDSWESHLKTVLDPEMPAFERQNNVVYATGNGSRIYPTPSEYPEVKEYMGWRLKRNRKRLQRLELAARIIQNAFRNHLSWLVLQRLRRTSAACLIQRLWRGWNGRRLFLEQMRRVWAAHVLQRTWRGYSGRGLFLLLRSLHAAAGQIERISRGFLGRMLVLRMRGRRRRAATVMQALVRRFFARKATFQLRDIVLAARTLQRVYRGHLGRRRAQMERHKFLFSKSQSQGIEFGRQMLLEHKLHATRLQSEVSLLTQEKIKAEEAVEAVLEEISEFEQGVSQLEIEMHQLSKIESETLEVLDEGAKYELREQKMRLDKEFGTMLAKIAERRDKLGGLEGKLATLDNARQGKEEQLRTLERKLVVLLEEQQRELQKIKHRQESRKDQLTVAKDAVGTGTIVVSGLNGEPSQTVNSSGPTAKEKRQAAQLMQSTETLMKFGFMSMSMTYFSSLNMIKAMRTVSVQDTVMAALHEKSSSQTASSSANVSYDEKSGGDPFKPDLKPGQMPGQEALKVSAWSVEDVARWLQTLSLGQYREAFIDAAVDGAFLYDLDEDDLRNTLGIEHRLHRKKIINMTNKLKAAEYVLVTDSSNLDFTQARKEQTNADNFKCKCRGHWCADSS